MNLATEGAEVGNTVTPNAGPRNTPHRVDGYADCVQQRCLYRNADGKHCMQLISCGAVPAHFESHGVKAICRMSAVTCRWDGCLENCLRHNFVRHIREKHLGHTRKSTVHNPEKGRRHHTSLRRETDGARSQNEPRVDEHAGSTPQLCKYRDPDGEPCMQEITYATVPKHFATCHGVKAISREQRVTCRWVGCVEKQVRRHSFVRHIREKHLGYTRGSALRKFGKAR
ncbi:hypothetical protein F5J12DRAFT_428922 [Pisolithus orientalis]|uniref:uncharacterized protein n=1 Tax=Pisolithus orientalis TaxID=936130 RepID=UPI0022240398|nr:uncharacterized protein F5J12DRAFT_428922 [Pisolithus orientalis]KAI5993760.1 hypothetical protein F5J12DRAFT_428922 [Pisolithus orientalis]